MLTKLIDLDLHIHKLNIPSISSRDNSQHIKGTTVTVPRWAIFEDFRDLKTTLVKIVEECCELMIFFENRFTFVGSRLTRPQALAATPLQLWETAMIPIDSGPG